MDDHMVYEGEAIGVILGLRLIRQEGFLDEPVTIELDNQAVILALLKRRATAGHYLIGEIQEQAERLIRDMGDEFKLTFRWVPGHENVEGNEAVDGRVKEAAEGQTSTARRLTPFLRRKRRLPRSLTATRQKLKEEMKREWEAEWERSPRWVRYRHIDDSMPSTRYMKHASRLKRPLSALTTQIRSGHIGLNGYLHWFARSESSDCPYCPGEEESVRHFLFQCPEYRNEQMQMRREVGRAAGSLAFLTSTEKGAKALARYVNKTGRLKEMFGTLKEPGSQTN